MLCTRTTERVLHSLNTVGTHPHSAAGDNGATATAATGGAGQRDLYFAF